MVADKGGIYFDANWLEVQMKYSYSVVVRGVPGLVSPPVWEILAAF